MHKVCVYNACITDLDLVVFINVLKFSPFAHKVSLISRDGVLSL